MKWGEGHIHETYLVETKSHDPDYILQKINSNIFRDIPGMMKNIEAVTGHLKMKLDKSVPGGSGFKSLELVSTKEGHSFYQDKDGSYWRMYLFIANTVTHQILEDPELASEAGSAIGLFQAMLADMQTPLVETIPDFHDINLRIRQYEEAKSKDQSIRLASVLSETQFAEIRFRSMKEYFLALQESAKVRPTHNDTKLNNILFDSHKRAVCLIDLDTVMPGYVHFDYGDALRTMANMALEDEKDLAKVHFDKGIYEVFTNAYLKVAENFLDRKEIDLLLYAPVYMTFIIGLRFLTDYFNGDIYYRVHYPEHNLVRARVQFRLAEEMESFLLREHG